MNAALTEEEKFFEELARKELKRKLKVENKRKLMAQGKIPKRDIDSEIEGLSSDGDIDNEHGLRGFDP